jgi:uncharacterized membrane protein
VLILGLLASGLLVTDNDVSPLEDSAPIELSMNLYRDGLVQIHYTLETNPSLARVNITLIGTISEDLIVKDENGILLDYKIFDGYITVDVLGSSFVHLVYYTSDLTSKISSLWILNFDAPVSSTLQLSRDATIINMNPSPMSIRSVEGCASLIMPSGSVSISYILGVVGTKEHALALRREAEAALSEFQAEGYNGSFAVAMLQKAKDAYDESQFVQAEEIAREVKEWLANTRAVIEAAEQALFVAENSIREAEDQSRTSSIEEARNELEAAREAIDSGNYGDAKLLAEDSIISSQSSEDESTSKLNPLLPLIVTIITFSLIFGLYWKRRVEPIPIEEEVVKKESPDIDLKLLFQENQNLRLDDKEVIRFIYTSGGGLFASELRKRFDLPKSSAWRMIRRLEREEIIVTRKVGRETYIQLCTKEDLLTTEGMEPSFQMVPQGS